MKDTEQQVVPSINVGQINDEFKEHGTKYILSKHEYDLYIEEKDVPMPIIRVKHFKLPNKGDRWKIFSDTKVVFILEGAKLNKKERIFLRTLSGVNFLISEQKSGISSLHALKTALKKIMNAAPLTLPKK